MQTFEALASDGRKALLLVEQYVELAMNFADRIVILDAGEIVHDGPAEAMKADPAALDRHVGVGLEAT